MSNVILVSPRKILLENKRDQHVEDVHLVQSILPELGVDFDLSPKAQKKGGGNKRFKDQEEIDQKEKERQELVSRNEDRIRYGISDYIAVRNSAKRPCKILVTYDSFRKVKETLTELGIMDEFHTIIDEFQSIFVDSKFKSDTELEFLSALKGLQKVCYVSATPMIQEYLEELNEFKDLPYIKLNWAAEDPGRVSPPGLEVYVLKSLSDVARKIISEYREGQFETSVRTLDGGITELVQSKEAVIYVNSVNNICQIIKNNELKPEEVNILCANTSDNEARIRRKIGSSYRIGKVPTKGEQHKMFTLCTRTVYLGADFYSDNARTFIISDANVDALAVDITLDLPQILGRQRLDSNPWKNKATIYAKTIIKNKELAKEEFEKRIKEKDEATDRALLNYEAVPYKGDQAKLLEYIAISKKYADDYVAVNKHNGKAMYPVKNTLVRISERRAYEIQQRDYKDRFSVFTRIQEAFKVDGIEQNRDIADFIDIFSAARTQRDKMRILCELDKVTRSRVIDLVPIYYKNFLESLGPERCKALGYSYSRMKAEMEVKFHDKDALADAIFAEFNVDEKYTLSNIKDKLKIIYQDQNYKKAAKAVDLEEWFEIKRVRITRDGKSVEGFKLIKKRV